MPALPRIDPHDLVAEVAILAEDVGVGVMDEVVRVAPRLGRRCRVPVPGPRVDHRIVHPVPLTVQHVVPDLHVLQDLGQTERGGAEHPEDPPPRGDHLQTSDQSQAALQGDHRADVLGVALTEVGLDVCSWSSSNSRPIASICSDVRRAAGSLVLRSRRDRSSDGRSWLRSPWCPPVVGSRDRFRPAPPAR